MSGSSMSEATTGAMSAGPGLAHGPDAGTGIRSAAAVSGVAPANAETRGVNGMTTGRVSNAGASTSATASSAASSSSASSSASTSASATVSESASASAAASASI